MPYANIEDKRANARRYSALPEVRKRAARLAKAPHRRRKSNATKRRKEYESKSFLIWYRGGCCQECGFVPRTIEDAYIMEFHHRDRTMKKFTIGLKLHYTIETLINEADLCDLYCSNCHRRIEHRLHNDRLGQNDR